MNRPSRLATSALLSFLAIAAAACSRGDRVSMTQTTSAVALSASIKTSDREAMAAVTPLDQGNGRADLDTTNAIRGAVMGDPSLSAIAKDVKITTNRGLVMLRGDARTVAERTRVEEKALAAAGNNLVDDQIVVEANALSAEK